MKKRICSECAYGVREPAFWMGQLSRCWPATLMCANCAESPGRLRMVCPGGTCRNFVVRHNPSYRLPAPEPTDDNVRYIPLTRGYFAIVDKADYDRLSKHDWLAMVSYNTVYAFRKEKGKVILMHREIMKPRKNQVVDHMNRNGIDNRRRNLRNCLNRENVCNARPRGGTSQYRGVCRHGDKWVADIGYLSIRVHIGRYAEEIEAARAHDRMAIMLHGQFAYLNLPDEWPQRKRDALHNSPEARQARADARRRSRTRKAAAGGKDKKPRRKGAKNGKRKQRKPHPPRGRTGRRESQL